MQTITLTVAAAALTISALSFVPAEARIHGPEVAAASDQYEQRRKCKRGFVYDADRKRCVRTSSGGGGTRGSF